MRGGDLAGVPGRLAAPISESEPAGADVTYEPVFERLREAVDRLASVGSAVDYENVGRDAEGPFSTRDEADHTAVVEGALDVLTEHAKDLRAAAYLAVSLAHTAGAAGLTAGLEGVEAMCRAFWADLYPSRTRARRGAFEFLAGRLSETVATWPPPDADEREPLDAALDALSRLQTLVAEEMGEDAPALSGLRRALAERKRRVPVGAPAEETDPPEVSTAKVPPVNGSAHETPALTPAPSPAPPAAGTPAPAAPPVDPVRAVVQAAAALREETPGSAVAVRLLRAVRWDALAAAPPAQDGATRIEAPAARRREALTALAETDPALFAEQAEQAFAGPPFHFWLDLQRLADGARRSLGAAHADAREALRSETARLVSRLPALLDLRFRDGTPFADEATRSWALGLAGPSPREAAPAVERAPVSDDPFAVARDQAAAGDLTGALDALAQAHPPGGRAGFVHRLRTAELCLRADRADLALALLTALAAEVRDRDLDAWEPALAADLYVALGQAARQSGRPEAAAEAAARLAAVAPARAARFHAS